MTQDTTTRAPAESHRTALEWLGILGPIAGLAVLVLFFAKTNWYLVFKSIHVLAAIVWLGGGTMISVLAWQAQRTKDYGQLLVLAMGFVLMHKGGWGYDHFWTIFGLVGWGVSFVVGAAFLGPEGGRLAKLIETKGPEDPEVRARLNRVISVARADVVLVLLIAADMVAKPFFG